MLGGGEGVCALIFLIQGDRTLSLGFSTQIDDPDDLFIFCQGGAFLHPLPLPRPFPLAPLPLCLPLKLGNGRGAGI